MSNENAVPENPEKFFFTTHNFDAPEEEEEDIYVAPTFSEEELAAAKEKAYAEGKQAGIDESTASRNQHIANVLNKIAESFPDLLAKENARAKLHEIEAVRLALAIFDKLFPLFREHFSEEELKAHIHEVLARQEQQSDIVITVHPDLTEPVEKMLSRATPKAGHSANMTVQSGENMDIQELTIDWQDGGALHQGEKLAQEIRNHLEEALAPFPAKRHDSEVEEPQDETQENVAPKEKPEEEPEKTQETDES